MKIVKIVFWIILIGLFGLVVYQELPFFLSKHSLAIHFGAGRYQTPELPMVVFFAAFFLLGWLIAYTFSLIERYKVGRANKLLRTTIDSQQEAISALKKDVDSLKIVGRPSAYRSEETTPVVAEAVAETPHPE